MTQAGLCFQVLPADGNDETPYYPAKFASPAEFVSREALLKAQNVARRFPEEDLVVIGCDTVAVCAGEILGKPSGLGLINPARPDATLVESVVTRLVMDPLSDEDLQAYLDSNQWQGKAGAFGYQDGIAWLHILSGTESNVVGLPIERLEELLKPKGGLFHL